MAPTAPRDDARADAVVERLLGDVLRYGVIIAGVVTIVGGAFALAWHGGATENFRTFSSEPPALRSITGILSGSWRFDPQSIVQLGIVLLVATPIVRVALSLVAFAIRRDRTYVVLTAIVLALLAVSLFSGTA